MFDAFRSLVRGGSLDDASPGDLRWLHREHLFRARMTRGRWRAWNQHRAAACRVALGLPVEQRGIRQPLEALAGCRSWPVVSPAPATEPPKGRLRAI